MAVGVWYGIQGTCSRTRDAFTAWIAWKIISQSIENNTSTIVVRSVIATSNTLRTWNGTCSGYNLTVNGVSVSPASFNVNTSNGWSHAAGEYSPVPTLGSLVSQIISSERTYTIAHNSDGTKSAAISCSFALDSGGWGPGNVSISGTAVLDTIPRASEITRFDAFTIDYGTNSTYMTFDRKSTSFTHDLELKIGTTLIGTRSGVGATYTWTLTEDEKNVIFNALKNTTSGTITLHCKTMSGTSQIGTTRTETATCTIGSTVLPTFTSITGTEYVSSVATIVGSFVQRLSRVSFAINGAAGAKYSTITAYRIVFDGVTYNTSTAITGVIQKSGNLTATATITDSRGRTAVRTLVINFLAYNFPVISGFSVQRVNSDGSENAMGTSAKVISVGSVTSLINTTQRNSLTYKVYSRVRGTTTWTLKKSLKIAGLSLNVTDIFGTYVATTSYDFRLDVVDEFNTTLSVTVLSTGVVTMSWGPEGIGVGKIWESGALDILGRVNVNGDVKTDRFYTLTSYANQLDGNARSWNIHIPSSTGTPNPVLAWTNNNGTRFTHVLNQVASHNHDASAVNSGVFTTARIPTVTHGMTNFANQSLNTTNAVVFNGITNNNPLTLRPSGANADAINVIVRDSAGNTSNTYRFVSAGAVSAPGSDNRYEVAWVTASGVHRMMHFINSGAGSLGACFHGLVAVRHPADTDGDNILFTTQTLSGNQRPCIRPENGDTRGFLGTAANRFYDVRSWYINGGSTREYKADIKDASLTDCYEKVKSLKLHRYKVLADKISCSDEEIIETLMTREDAEKLKAEEIHNVDILLDGNLKVQTKKKLTPAETKAKRQVLKDEYLATHDISGEPDTIGLIADEAPDDITDDIHENINLYAFISMVCGALQETQARLEKLEKEVAG